MKRSNTKADAVIVVIGNEILSGRTQDVNVSFLSKWLNNLGVRVSEVRIIEDKEESIVSKEILKVIYYRQHRNYCSLYRILQFVLNFSKKSEKKKK